jgi:RNA polymerase primary sigma factor
VAKKYQGQGLPLEDLISEGNVGLVNAVDRFKVDMGYHFISYAVWWIRQSILNALCEKSRMIRLPHNRASELIQIERARKTVQKQHSFEEEIREIANIVDMEESHVMELLNISRDMLSLESPVSGNQDSSLGDFIEDSQYATPYQNAEQSILESEIENVLNTLEKNEAEVIRYHYGLNDHPVMSLKEIGDRFQLSKERIRQIEEKAISRLRNPLRREKLKAYVA